jgi:hypothetical protein
VRLEAALLGALLIGGCAGASSRPVTLTSPADTGFIQLVNPFPVTDTTGRLLELAFLGGFNSPRPQLADLDGDGDLDLAIQEFTGRLLTLKRDGQTAQGLPRFVFDSWRYQGLDVGEWSRFADLDGDGDLDLLAELPFGYLRYLRNDGSRAALNFVVATDTLRDVAGDPIFSDRQNIPQVGDLDCDGVPDLLIGRISGTILHYRATTASTPVPRFRLVTERFQDLSIVTGQGSLHGANTMAFADVDEDGDLDLVWGDFFEAGLLFFENDGSCAAPSMRPELVRFPVGDPIITSGYNAPSFGDVTGDGRLDLVMGVLGGAYDPNRSTVENLYFLSRGATGQAWTRHTTELIPMIDVGSESIPVLVDDDGDGDLDLLVANKIEPTDRKTSRIYRYENVGTPTRPAFQLRGPISLGTGYHQAPAFGDLNGDGQLDILVGSWGASVAWYRGDGRGYALADSAMITLTRGSNTTPALGDLDGDGDLDLLIGEASGPINFYRNEGTPQAPRFALVSDTWLGIDVGRRSAPTLVDIDRDGDLDLVIGSDDQGLQLFRNQGTRTVPRFVLDPSFRLDIPPIAAPAFGDLDGDGDLDLVVGNVGGGLRYYEYRGKPR